MSDEQRKIIEDFRDLVRERDELLARSRYFMERILKLSQENELLRLQIRVSRGESATMPDHGTQIQDGSGKGDEHHTDGA